MLAPFSDQSGLACQDERWQAAALAAHEPEAVAAPPPWRIPPAPRQAAAAAARDSDSESEEPAAGEGAETDLLTTAVREQAEAAVFEPEEQPEPPSPRLEPLEEPEGPDAADAEAEPSKKKDTFDGIELVPGTFLSFAVDTAEPAAEPLQQVGGGQTDP